MVCSRSRLVVFEVGEIFFRFLQVGGVRSFEILVIRLVQGVATHRAERVFHLAGFLGLAELEDRGAFLAVAEMLVDPEFRGDEIAVAAGAHLRGGLARERGVLFFKFLQNTFRQFFLRLFGEGDLVADGHRGLLLEFRIGRHLLLVDSLGLFLGFDEHDCLRELLAALQQ